MSDEELLLWGAVRLHEFSTAPRLRVPFYLTPLWAAARDRFEAHPYSGNLLGLRDMYRDAQYGKPLALAMLREFHTQYALQVLIS